MAKSYIEKMEEAAGIGGLAFLHAGIGPVGGSTRMPYGKGESIPQGGIARPWTGPRPWKDRLIPRAKGGPVSPGRSLMKMKGSALAGFMPEAKKLKKGKKRGK